MDASTYAIEAEVESTHWWFVVRRRLFAKLIADQGYSSNARVLDIGTSTGTNLRLLKELGYTNRVGLDMSDEAIRWCAEKGLGEVKKGDACQLPFKDEEFDLVLATDILEHIDNDLGAAAEIRRVLAPNGVAIITVPAFQSLWGLQDDVAHHKRRYLKKQLLDCMMQSELEIRQAYYFNYLLFVPIWIARRIIRLFRLKLDSENELNTPLLNSFLLRIFTLDVVTAGRVRPPFGVSILAVVQRKT